jgi:hypothetical protein
MTHDFTTMPVPSRSAVKAPSGGPEFFSWTVFQVFQPCELRQQASR